MWRCLRTCAQTSPTTESGASHLLPLDRRRARNSRARHDHFPCQGRFPIVPSDYPRREIRCFVQRTRTSPKILISLESALPRTLMAGRLGKKSTRKTNLFCATFLPISDRIAQFWRYFKVAQIRGIRANFETRSATFEDPAQLCDRRAQLFRVAATLRWGILSKVLLHCVTSQRPSLGLKVTFYLGQWK